MNTERNNAISPEFGNPNDMFKVGQTDNSNRISRMKVQEFD